MPFMYNKINFVGVYRLGKEIAGCGKKEGGK